MSQALFTVSVGAGLASLGGILSGRLLDLLERRRKESSAALLCGEILASLENLIEQAARTQSCGHPFGPITMRLISAARREIEVYERNRETMFALSRPKLRAEVHNLMVRLSIPLDRLLEESLRHGAALQSAGSSAALRISECEASMARSFDVLTSGRPRISATLAHLRPYARDRLDAYLEAEG